MNPLRGQLKQVLTGQSNAAPLLLDAAAVLFLLFVGLTVWPMDGDPSLPFWASPADPLVEGPDSGAWAANILAWSDGDYGYLESQRMPTYVLFSGLATAWTGSVALGGHLVNHLVHLLTPLLLFGIGRLMGSRAVGFGAGLLCAVCPFLVQASWRFGVDPTVAFVIPLSLWMGLLAARWWWLGPLVAQVSQTVRWVDCVSAMREQGAQDFVEFGPGRALTGLIKKLDRSLKVRFTDRSGFLEQF